MNSLHLDKNELSEILFRMKEARAKLNNPASNESRAYIAWLESIILKLELALPIHDA